MNRSILKRDQKKILLNLKVSRGVLFIAIQVSLLSPSLYLSVDYQLLVPSFESCRTHLRLKVEKRLARYETLRNPRTTTRKNKLDYKNI